jgi:hypothetical protein
MDDLQDRHRHIMLSEAKHLRQPITVNPMIGCFASLSMTRQGTILMACREKVTATCHSERSEASTCGTPPAWWNQMLRCRSA